MKARKKDIALFDVIYERMIRNLVNDLKFYKTYAIESLSNTDLKAIDVTNPKEIERLACMFLLHRIEQFDGYGNQCDSALYEAENILKG